MNANERDSKEADDAKQINQKNPGRAQNLNASPLKGNEQDAEEEF